MEELIAKAGLKPYLERVRDTKWHHELRRKDNAAIKISPVGRIKITFKVAAL